MEGHGRRSGRRPGQRARSRPQLLAPASSPVTPPPQTLPLPRQRCLSQPRGLCPAAGPGHPSGLPSLPAVGATLVPRPPSAPAKPPPRPRGAAAGPEVEAPARSQPSFLWSRSAFPPVRPALGSGLAQMGQDGTEPGAQSLLPASPFSSSFSGRFCVPAGATVSLLSVSDGVSADTVGVGEPHVPDCPMPSAPLRRSQWPQWPRCRLLPHSEDSALCFCSLEDTAVAVSHRAPGVSAAGPPSEQARGATCTELSAEQGLALLSPAGRTHSRLLCTPGPPGWEVRGSGRPGGREGAGGCGGGGGGHRCGRPRLQEGV